MQQDIILKTKNILEKLGLNKNQIVFYLTLFELGEADLSEVISKAGLKRPTAYRVLTELEKLGLVASDFKKYRRKVSVVSPKRIAALAANRQRKMRRLELAIGEFMPSLGAMFEDKQIRPKIEMFDDEQGYSYLAGKSLDCQDKEILFLGNVGDIYHVLGKEYDLKYFVPTRMKRGVRFKWLVYKNQDTLEYKKRDKDEMRETRFLSVKFKLNATMMIYDNTILFFSSYKEPIALSITSQYLAEMHKAFFKVMWENAVGCRDNF